MKQNLIVNSEGDLVFFFFPLHPFYCISTNKHPRLLLDFRAALIPKYEKESCWIF